MQSTKTKQTNKNKNSLSVVARNRFSHGVIFSAFYVTLCWTSTVSLSNNNYLNKQVNILSFDRY